tara:strand:+ start:1174 stop:1815 length:642 start_codon:yes stop_codon:yes gene_type:complete
VQLWKKQKDKDEREYITKGQGETYIQKDGNIQIQSVEQQNVFKEEKMIGSEFISIAKSVCGLTLKKPSVILLSGFSIGTIYSFTNAHIYNPADQYYSLMLLILVDNLTGMYVALKNQKFCTSKAKRVLYTLIGHTAILFFAFQLGRESKPLFFLKDAVFVPLVLINLLSFVKNLSLLGYLPKTFAKYLYKKVNTYDNELSVKDLSDPDPDKPL